MESQETQNSEYNIDREGQSWRTDITWHQDLLQSNYNQDHVVLVKEQTKDQCNRIESQK